jgi:hypothetical protein
MNNYGLSDYMEKLKRTQELPIQPLDQQAPQSVADQALQMPELGQSFKEQQAASMAKAPSLGADLSKSQSQPMNPQGAKAAIEGLGSMVSAYLEAQRLDKEGQIERQAKAEGSKAKGRYSAVASTGAEQFGGLANLMDVYRGVYGGRRR